MIGSLARFALEVGSELWREWRKERAQAKAQREWAETPATIRGCARCNEIAYTPGQVACSKCGGLL